MNNNNKHTAGTWKAAKYSSDWGVYSLTGDGNDIAIVRDKGGEEGAANAALIAASPQLLQICIATLEDIESGDFYSYPETIEAARKNLTAAIHQATGK